MPDIEAKRLIASVRDTAEAAKGMIDRLAHGGEAVRKASEGRERTHLEKQALQVLSWIGTDAMGLEEVRQAASELLEPETRKAVG